MTRNRDDEPTRSLGGGTVEAVGNKAVLIKFDSDMENTWIPFSQTKNSDCRDWQWHDVLDDVVVSEWFFEQRGW